MNNTPPLALKKKPTKNTDYPLWTTSITQKTLLGGESLVGQGGIYEVIDARVPEGVAESDIPVLYATGFGSVGEMIPGVLGTFPQDEHRRLLTWNEMVGASLGDELYKRSEGEDGYFAHEQEIAKPHLAKALGILETLKEKSISQTDAFGHSEGAIHLVIAAALEPSRFRNIVLNSPAGLSGNQSLWQLTKATINERSGRSKTDTSEEDESYNPAATKINPFNQERFNPHGARERNFVPTAKHLWDSINLMTHTQIQDILLYLKEQGVNVSIVHGENDGMFTAEGLQETLASGPNGEYSDFVDSVTIVPDADHDSVIRQPELFKNTVVKKIREMSDPYKGNEGDALARDITGGTLYQ